MSLNTTTARRAAAVLAPAACIVIVVALFSSSGQKSAFAAAIEHLKQAGTIVCRVTTTIGVKMQLDPEAGSSIDPAKLAEFDKRSKQELIRNEKLYMSTEYGVRRDTYEDGVLVRTTYRSENTPMLILNRVDRTYHTDDESWQPDELKEAFAKTRPEINFMSLSQDPDRLLRGLRNLTADADRELGRDTIDGGAVIGYEIAGEKVGFGPPWTDRAKENRAELWVDAESGVPVRLVFHFVTHVSAMSAIPVPMSASFALTTVYDRFELDTPLSADRFEPVIPDDYTLRQDSGRPEMQMPDEAALHEALRVFSELAGRYPSSLTAMSLGHETSVLIGTIVAKRIVAERAGRTDAEIPDVDFVGKKLRGLMLYAFLEMTGHEPEYFGAEVKPGEAEKVLMRWRLDDGDTRVIYGDLRAETVPGSRPQP